MKKYIKKDEFKNIKHVLSNKFGTKIIVDSNEIEDEEIYNMHRFMFDVVEIEEETQDEVIEVIEDSQIVKEQETETIEEVAEELKIEEKFSKTIKPKRTYKKKK